jgi:hypothetical protein
MATIVKEFTVEATPQRVWDAYLETGKGTSGSPLSAKDSELRKLS